MVIKDQGLQCQKSGKALMLGLSESKSNPGTRDLGLLRVQMNTLASHGSRTSPARTLPHSALDLHDRLVCLDSFGSLRVYFAEKGTKCVKRQCQQWSQE